MRVDDPCGIDDPIESAVTSESHLRIAELYAPTADRKLPLISHLPHSVDGPSFATIPRGMHPSNRAASSIHAAPAGDRRRALVLLINGAIASIVGGLGCLLGIFALRPTAGAVRERWVHAGTLMELRPDTPIARVLSVPRADGWYRERVRQTVFLVRDGRAVKALSATCTHLGCQVRWDAEVKRFLCPCHGGEYDAQGRVVAGPPPRALDTIEVRVDAATDSIRVRV
jgi:menaquinol-cytochrome c reductase iron-sulfur subunit